MITIRAKYEFDERTLRYFIFVSLLLFMLSSITAAQGPLHVDPPQINEAALVKRLVDMTKPSAGERAIILFDPTYYPGVTKGLREALHAKGVYTYVLVEETPAIIATYSDNDTETRLHEDDVVRTLGPMFKTSDIFYWMPLRNYAGDMRWERLVADSHIRSVHCHWLLPFPGTRTAAEILTSSREVERRAIEVDLADHAQRQQRLAAALRGQKIRVTTPEGTDLVMDVASDEWIHFGNGDASKARMATARSVRDRQIEIPVGMFVFTPDANTVNGTILAPAIFQADAAVKDVRLRIQRGRISEMSGTGTNWIRDRIRVIGPDGDKFACISLNTNASSTPDGVVIVLGSNWEEAELRRRNRPTRIRRMTIRLRNATLTADDKVVIRDGRLVNEF